MGMLTGRVVVVTGAGRGIGRAAALACADAGARLVLCDAGVEADGSGADPEVVERARDEVATRGADVVSLASDVTADEVPDRLVEAAQARFGRLDGVLACAGIAHEQSLLRLTDRELDRVYDVHARAALRLARAASLAMRQQDEGGSIVLASGQAAFIGERGQSACAAASAAVSGFVRAAALDLRRHRIRINALCATARTRTTAQTPAFQSLPADALTPEHVAQAVVFLLSPRASDVSGECVGVAGRRIYSLRLHETTGVLLESDASTADDIARAWPQATKA